MMGWRQRDWAKFNDDERRAFFGASGGAALPPPSAEGRPAHVPRTRSLRGRHGLTHREEKFVSTLVAITAVLTLTYLVLTHVDSTRSVGPPHLVSPLNTSAPSAATNVVGIRWRTTDLAVAATAGRICVTTTAHGRICASYAIGEKPADSLTRQIEALGLRVQSNG